MRIVHVVQRFHPAVGGAETQVRLIATELARRGNEVVVLTTSSLSPSDIPTFHRPFAKKPPDLPRFEIMNGFQVYRYRALFRFYGGILTEPMRELWTIDADIIHAHSYYVSTSLVAALASKERGIPLVLTANDATTGLNSSALERFLARTYDYTAGAFLGSTARRIVAVSEANRQDMISAGLPGEKNETIPNAIDLSSFGRSRKTKREDEGPRILYVGRLSRDKGVQHLLRAAPKVLNVFPATKLVIVGQDYGYRPTLERLAQNLGISGSVSFAGRAPNEDLPAIYQSSDLFVLPSELEAFGIALIEAMAMGVPVIASDHGGMRCVIENGKTGALFEPGNSDHLASVIIELLSNDEFRDVLTENALNNVIQEYAVETVVDQLETLYRAIL